MRSGTQESALWKAVELSAANSWSGAMVVQYNSHTGSLWFDRGQLVHAAEGERTGEDAFRAVMLWPASDYALQPDAATPEVSITRTLADLLEELRGGEEAAAHAKASANPEGAAAHAPSPRRAAAAPGLVEWLVATTERVREVPGVLGAMLRTTDGEPIAGLGPRSPDDAEALALQPAARRLGEALSLGPTVLGVARGAERLVLLVAAHGHELTIVLRVDDQLDAVEARVRALLLVSQPAP